MCKMQLKKALWSEGVSALTEDPNDDASTPIGDLVTSLNRHRLYRELILVLRTGLRDACAEFSVLRVRGLCSLLKSLRSVADSDSTIDVFSHTQSILDLQDLEDYRRDMEVQQVLRMKGGGGKNSYAQNSLLQRTVMSRAKPVLEQSLTELYTRTSPDLLVMADLGCGSGSNSLLLVREAIDIIRQNCMRLKMKPPIFQFFLNDLPTNDFNSIFNSLPSFYEELKRENGNDVGQCFVAATVGSFNCRLFPRNSLHFVHSSYCLHWRSKVPEGLVTETGIALNKKNICAGKSSNERVVELYSDLFKKDFSEFLRSRSAELIDGGSMVLTLLGRQTKNQHLTLFDLLADCLQDMAIEKEIEEAKADSFNIPFYKPSTAEIEGVIEREGLFSIRRLQTFKVNWDPRESPSFNRHSRGEYVARIIRAITESMIASHFGHQILDGLFQRLAQKVEEYEEIGIGEHLNVVVSMTKSSSSTSNSSSFGAFNV